MSDMAAFLFTLLMTFATATGGHAQVIVARFASELDRTAPLLATGIASAALSTAFMAHAGAALAAIMAAETAGWLLPAVLFLAAARLVPPVRTRPMLEPTRSFVAILAVLFFRQLADAPRLIVFALAFAIGNAATIVTGGAMGSAGAIALGWLVGASRLERFPLRAMRLTLAAGLALSAAAVAWSEWPG